MSNAKHTPETGTSYSFVLSWFKNAQKGAANAGKSDSAALWREGIEHLEHMRKQRDELLCELKKLVDNNHTEGRAAGLLRREMTWLKDARRVIAKVESGAA